MGEGTDATTQQQQQLQQQQQQDETARAVITLNTSPAPSPSPSPSSTPPSPPSLHSSAYPLIPSTSNSSYPLLHSNSSTYPLTPSISIGSNSSASSSTSYSSLAFLISSTSFLLPAPEKTLLQFIRKVIKFTLLAFLALSPILIPLHHANSTNINDNAGALVALFLLSHWLWAYRIVFTVLELGLPPLPRPLEFINSYVKLPYWFSHLVQFWPASICSFVFVFIGVLVPCFFKAFPVPFLIICLAILMGFPAHTFIMKILFTQRVLNSEVLHSKLGQVGKSLSLPVGYTLIGVLFLCGFYNAPAIVQLILVLIINSVSFLFRVVLRRLLRTLGVVHFEGPILFYIFNLSQYFTLQSLPASEQIYVLVGALLVKVASGLWPLIEWKKIFRSSRVDVLPSSDYTPKRSAISLFLFPLEEKEVERDALTSFVIMFSAVTSCLIFFPIYLFLNFGYSARFFSYYTSTTEAFTTFLIYMFLTTVVSTVTFIFTNGYFHVKFRVNALRIGVDDLEKHFTLYFTISMFALVVFFMLNMSQTNNIYYVAEYLYGV